MVEKSQDKEMDKSVAVGNVENNSEKDISFNCIILKYPYCSQGINYLAILIQLKEKNWKPFSTS